MNTTTHTVTLTDTNNGRVAVACNGETLGTVKNGGNIVRNADRILTKAGFFRSEGYRAIDGVLTAPARTPEWFAA